MLEQIRSEMPKSKESIESFFGSCIQRKRFLEEKKEEFFIHLEKAKHDLTRAIAEFEDKCYDWTVVKAYYAMHHAANSLLIKKKGLFSKDHICLVIALKHFELIPDNFYEKLRELHSKFSDFTAFDMTYSLRKISQYDVIKWKQVSENDALIILEFSKKFIGFVESESA